MSIEGSIEQWIGFSTALPWGMAFEAETNTYKIVAHTPDGQPRIAADGKQVVVARGLTQPDALILIGLRERYRSADNPRTHSKVLRIVE